MPVGGFKVVIPRIEAEKLKRWATWAKQKNVLEEFLVALNTINFRLTVEPRDWGEPRYTLRDLGLEIRFGTFSMMNVWYGVSYEKPLVFVKLFQFRTDYSYGAPPDDDGVGGNGD